MSAGSGLQGWSLVSRTQGTFKAGGINDLAQATERRWLNAWALVWSVAHQLFAPLGNNEAWEGQSLPDLRGPKMSNPLQILRSLAAYSTWGHKTVGHN